MRTATIVFNRAVSRRRAGDETGMALITTILVMMLCSVLMVGFVTAIVADQRASGLDRDQTQAYAVAHAGLEQLTSDLSTLFTTDFSPSRAQVDALVVNPPALPGFQYLSPGRHVGISRRSRARLQRAEQPDRRPERHDHRRSVPGVPRDHHAL